ncbi:DNA-binding MarR family transcriptional regulator [Novosphingobium sp. SG751A]|uniref:MarR family winged helix-turn-helix transcriptional regulator n=1 Tax=Novosphingobium sp. SG751A TaxID=2587000 RepID=UPI001C12B557|nr:MarR family transcriptional regulator [Novosphingobium sp. SG751A]NOW46433.1 DNA-binding MarR family transcriptional regulator [Novosphingobium sp. SG751A]
MSTNVMSPMHPVSDLSAHTGFLMRMVSNAVSQGFAGKLAGQDVTLAEWVMLRALYGGKPLPPSLLARKMGMTKGAISKLADRLLDKGLIARTDNPNDKRAHSLSLTHEGIAKVPALARLADESDAAFFIGLSDADHAALRGLLHKLINAHALTTAPVE